MDSCRDKTCFDLKSILITGTAIALVCPVLEFALRGSLTLGEFLRSLTMAFLFSNSIALLATLSAGYLLPRVRGGIAVKGVVIVFILLAAGVVGTLLSMLVLAGVGLFPWVGFWTSYLIAVRIALVITFTLGAGSWAFEALRERLQKTTLALRTQQLERERAEKLATEAQLSSLESRIHPHFLFNALNSISSLIREDPGQAERTVERMAALLRFSLDSARMGQVPLGQEMKIVRDYLEIEKVRFGERLRYSLHIAPGIEHALVPPMSVQTLVENSIKYAVAPKRNGGDVNVRAESVDSRIRVEVSDDGPGFSLEEVPQGHGLDNLRSRLDTIYGSAAGIEVRRTAGGTAVILTLPLGGNAAVA
jgi:sensor histidine kinase YesM